MPIPGPGVGGGGIDPVPEGDIIYGVPLQLPTFGDGDVYNAEDYLGGDEFVVTSFGDGAAGEDAFQLIPGYTLDIPSFGQGLLYQVDTSATIYDNDNEFVITDIGIGGVSEVPNQSSQGDSLLITNLGGGRLRVVNTDCDNCQPELSGWTTVETPGCISVRVCD